MGFVVRAALGGDDQAQQETGRQHVDAEDQQQQRARPSARIHEVAAPVGEIGAPVGEGRGKKVLLAGRLGSFGAHEHGALLREGLVDEVLLYLAPSLLGDRARGMFDLPELNSLAERQALDLRDVRRIGSCALDLCMVAAGRVDAHYEHGLNPWDWAAGALVAAEAGATVRVPEGFGDAGEITVAAAPGIAVAFNELLAELGANDAAPN